MTTEDHLTQGRRRAGPWRASAKKMLLIPKVAWLARSAPKDVVDGWNSYWSGVTTTGIGGDVLWDSADLNEFDKYLPHIRQHFDPALPIVDVGCGNGSFTRYLAELSPMTIGIDLSPGAVALAERECAGHSRVQFRQLDATVPGAADALAAEIGPANVFIRGVFHILSTAGRSALAGNLLPLTGRSGRVMLVETNYVGGSLGYLASLGATGRRIPDPLERAIRVLAPPGHFGRSERRAAFPEDDWVLVDDGPTVIQTIPLRSGADPEQIAGYYAVMSPRHP